MSYIGNTSTTQAFTPAVDYFSGNGSTTAFTLSRPVASVAQVEAVIDNVVQNPSSAYTVSGNTITFTSAPLSGTNNIYVRYTSPITQVIAPGQGTVGTSAFASSTGSGAVVLATSPTIISPIITGSLPQVTVYTSGSGTYTTPVNARFLYIRVVGGGGGGGGAAAANAAQCSAAAGGGGGGYSELLITSPSSTYSYAVGAGGNGGAAGNNGGATGGTTSFGTISATGGGGGAGSGNGNLTACFKTSGGGNGGVGSGGNINSSGGTGYCGWLNQGVIFGGGGGNSVLSGYSQQTVDGTSPGNSGSAYGGGGCGAHVAASGAAQVGGAGASGVIIITAFF